MTHFLDHQRSQHWLEQDFHSNGLTGSRCRAGWEEAYIFRRI